MLNVNSLTIRELLNLADLFNSSSTVLALFQITLTPKIDRKSAKIEKIFYSRIRTGVLIIQLEFNC